MTTVEQIAETVLYEGYLLWPYRRSAQKNQQRWTFGGVYPRRYIEARGNAGSDPDSLWWMQTECLLRADERDSPAVTPHVTVKVRFLHVVRRDVLRCLPDGSRHAVDELQVGSQRYLAWDEATERTVTCELLALSGGIANRPYTARRVVPIDIPAGQLEEPLKGPDGDMQGWLVRSWEALKGSLHIKARPVDEEQNLYRLTVRINNETPWHGEQSELRQPLSHYTFNSTHTILNVQDGAFISLMDPPPELVAEARACENVKTWPVLAGAVGAGHDPPRQHHTMLSSPIILYDYPQVAPESPGNLFDSTEIDELLILNLLTLTDEEKEEIRATDPRARELLERSESLSGEDFMRLHGAIREFRTLRPSADPDVPRTSEVPGTWLMEELERPAPEHVLIDGEPIRAGSRVRLHPRPGGDIMDLALDQKIAIVQAIEQDYEGRVQLAVVLEDDPGRDLALDQKQQALGHRFFFSPEEVEPLPET